MDNKEKVTIASKNGYDIPCIHNLNGNEKKVVLISHGFGSSKESPTVQALSRVLCQRGIGSFAFDFPAHGESPVDGTQFRIGHCLDDLAAAEAAILSLASDAEISYFSSSFGAYINLLYLTLRPHAGRKSFLRCAAVDMAAIFREQITRQQVLDLEEKDFSIVDYDYVRPLKLTSSFIGDLLAYDVFRLYQPGEVRIAMAHGDQDETASYDEACRFAGFAGAVMMTVRGGDHCFSNPGGMEQVLSAALRFFES